MSYSSSALEIQDLQPAYTPIEAPLAMPIQNLGQHAGSFQARLQPPRVIAARSVVILGIFATLGFAILQLIPLCENQKLSPFAWAWISVLLLSLAWIAFSAASSLTSLFLIKKPNGIKQAGARAGLSDSLTVLLMPLYNEAAEQSIAILQSMAEALARENAARHFEIFVISDSTDPAARRRELLAIDRLRRNLDGMMEVWYRGRKDNVGRKAGNVADFVRHWGGRYDFMIVLDADSLMAAPTMTELARRMLADPRLGILQTVPRLHKGRTLFARIQQFSSTVYGHSSAAGMAAWSGDTGNYWGHNAIIRVSAFAQSCGLPQLSGRKPFGGHILSHDFVEAALLCRAGWKVRIAEDLAGSWEEGPPSLSDLIVRDRRWAQGNMQHLKVIGAAGLKPASRCHLLVGIMGYLASPLWLFLILFGFALPSEKTLITSAPMIRLFAATLILLFLPRILGLGHYLSLYRKRKIPGGQAGLFASVALEIIFSALCAPVLMLCTSRHLLQIFRGRDSGWSRQRRSIAHSSWAEAWRMHWPQMLAGILSTAAVAVFAPQVFWWFSPVFLGLLLSVPLSRLAASEKAGRAFAARGLFHSSAE